MAHFFVPPKNFQGKTFFFERSESRHLAKVLRKKPGDVIQIFDGQGLIQTAKILSVTDSKVQGKIAQPSPLIDRSSLSKVFLELHVFPAVLKGQRFDWMLEKLTEVGARSIHPILTERTVVKISAADSSAKIRRWENIVLSAAKQCGRRDFARVFPAVPFAHAVDGISSAEISLVLWESEEKRSLSEVLRITPPHPKKFGVNLFVGPEGGLSVQESEKAVKAGIVPVHLGENILRAETAAVAAASVLILGAPWSGS